MDKILAIAQGITNPFSLLALTYLVLFLLFRGVLAKAGPQRGERAYQIIKYLMTLVAVIAVLTLLLVFALKAYEVYQAKTTEKFVEHALQNAVDQLSSPDLQVGYKMDDSLAYVLIGNSGQGIIIVSDLTLHWIHKSCSKTIPLSASGARLTSPLITYRYDVALTEPMGTKLLDDREFKYGTGEADKFLIYLGWPATPSMSTVWLTFTYKTLREQASYVYETAHIGRRHWRCTSES